MQEYFLSSLSSTAQEIIVAVSATLTTCHARARGHTVPVALPLGTEEAQNRLRRSSEAAHGWLIISYAGVHLRGRGAPGKAGGSKAAHKKLRARYIAPEALFQLKWRL